MAEYGFDKLCHKVFSARDNGVDFLSRGTGVKCGRCGHELVAYYCESRLYMVQCRHCAIKSLVMAKDRKEAAEKICGCAVDVVKIPSTGIGDLSEKAQPVKSGRWVDRYGGKYANPLNVGDKVWRICWDKVAKEWVVDDTPTFVSEVGTRVFFVSYTNFDPEDLEEPIPFDEIGNTCFLSREEAVAAATVKAPSEQESEVEEDEKK